MLLAPRFSYQKPLLVLKIPHTQKHRHSGLIMINDLFTYFLGGIIALGVFGGFVFLAAIITTIVILIRR